MCFGAFCSDIITIVFGALPQSECGAASKWRQLCTQKTCAGRRRMSKMNKWLCAANCAAKYASLSYFVLYAKRMSKVN